MLIAQISDLHVRFDGVRLLGTIDTEEALARTIAHLNQLDPRPDVALATGDLTNDGGPEDYRGLRSALDRLAMPYFVIPGNHDDRDLVRQAFADHGYLPAAGTFLQYVIDTFPLRLIALDTVLPGEVGGGLCDERLRWLADRLAEQPQRPTLIFMHHPPFPTGIRFMDVPAFEGADALEALIRRHPQVRQIVCGHLHRATHLNWAGTVAAIAPSIVFQMNLGFNPGERHRLVPDPPAVALYFWENGVGPVGYTSLILS